MCHSSGMCHKKKRMAVCSDVENGSCLSLFIKPNMYFANEKWGSASVPNIFKDVKEQLSA